MSPTNIFLTSALICCTLIGLGETAFSHVYQSTRDYTIAHKNFHEHAPVVLPYLLSDDEPRFVASSAVSQERPNFDLSLHQKLTSAPQPSLKPFSAGVTKKFTKPREDLPPGYVSLPAMIDVPPGYQLYKKITPRYF